MAIRKETWEKIIFAVLIAITVGIAKQIYLKLPKPAKHMFLALVNLFYSMLVFLLFMSFVAGRVKVITEAFPQFEILSNTWVLVPFAVFSFIFIYIFLIMLLRWYFGKKALTAVVGGIVRPFTRGIKAVKGAAAKGAKTGVSATKKVGRKAERGAMAVTETSAKCVGKAASTVDKIVARVVKKPLGQNSEQQTDSEENLREQQP
jgi:hypothetical protein